MTTDETCAALNVAPRTAIGIAARNVGSGSQTSKAGRGKTSGGVSKLHSESVTAVALDQVPRDAHVVRDILRSRERDLRRDDGPRDDALRG